MVPSSMVWKHICAVYRYSAAQDVDAGAVPSQAGLVASGVPCNVQPGTSTWEVVAKRTRQTTEYEVWLPTDYALAGKDLIVWTDPAGVAHNLTVMGPSNQVGLGIAVRVRCTEVK